MTLQLSTRIIGFLLLKDDSMAVANKAKTHKGAKKRFRLTSSGRIRRRAAFRSHGLAKQNTKRRKQKIGGLSVHSADSKRICKLLEG